ncbi:F-box domain protein [Aspergillus flavus]|uniref:F-box domain protein n=1 Tax=Aspergillus flavus (strain ATCC 200026 / FGSC A1120 / IAM 13836 / NRRL 3357 / JCM 12722 / SRRC 167) TaxID=332952 RepID=A0A7U2MYY1_ASPFN|nr:F-box domain protein [Aspergillus flavus]
MGIVRDILTWLSSYWHPRPIQIETPSYRGPNLDHLPTELVYMIANNLTSCDRVCLALCNNRLLSVLGNGFQLALENEFRATLLTRLSQDLPEHIHCHVCSVLHRRKYIPPPGPAFWPRRCLAKHKGLFNPWSIPFSIPWSSLYRFEHIHLQLAMKRHHCGPEHGISTDSLAYVEVQLLQNSITTLVSFDVQVVRASSLCLRTQTWILAKELPSKLVEGKWICAHISMGDHHILQIVRAAWDAAIKSSPGRRPALDTYRCVTCGLDYEIDATTCGTAGISLIVTKWLDLGPGLDPTDVRWTRHLIGSLSLRKQEMTTFNSDVRSQFERDTVFPLDDLTGRNRSLLEDRGYVRQTDWWYNGCWILQANKRLPWLYPRPEKPICHICKN